MKVDPRNFAALQIQLDALVHQAQDLGHPELDQALGEARKALLQGSTILKKRGLFLQVPHDYKPPTDIGGLSSRPKPRPLKKRGAFLQVPDDYQAPGKTGRADSKQK